MSTTEKDIASAVDAGGQHDHHEIPWIRKYVFATDHKMIAKQFMFVSLFFLVVGGALAGMMRFQLGFPGQPMPPPVVPGVRDNFFKNFFVVLKIL